MPFDTTQVYIPPELLEQTKTEVVREYPDLNSSIEGCIIDTKTNIISILKYSEKDKVIKCTKEELDKIDNIQYIPVITEKAKNELIEWANKSSKLREEFEKIDKKFILNNIDVFLKDKNKRDFIKSYIKDFGGKFDNNNNIIIGKIVLNKGTEKYNSIIKDILKDIALFLKFLYIDKYKNRKIS